MVRINPPFHPWFRGKVQTALTEAWNSRNPLIQPISPARIVARLLEDHLGDRLSDHVFVDFCAGGGGPTPSVERYINEDLSLSLSPSSSRRLNGSSNGNGKAAREPVQFVLTDLHPHIENWSQAASRSPNLHFSPGPVDASDAPADLLTSRLETTLPPSVTRTKKPFRLYNLAFHHFDDPLARPILRNTIETSDGFAIFELQDRSVRGFLAPCLFGIGILLTAPAYAWRWRSPSTLFWCWIIPILPFVLVFDGWISALRTRTVDEVEVLMRTCGVGEKELERWELKSGSVPFIPLVASLNWIICTKRRE
ncbi:hypothetical protein VPNG_04400 [Cytospora leucostoma]|uniref:Methyltransferase domain-containing protein n=1 Tax=Cytospora leucostoma TaxID=1230097 RepID=A0A423XBX6_9PEZI|nr:hypothetical protein VPNG_04400 [Cytospora leucostoma]